MATRDDGKTSPFMDDPDLQNNIDSEKKKPIIRDSVLNPNMNQQQQAGDPPKCTAAQTTTAARTTTAAASTSRSATNSPTTRAPNRRTSSRTGTSPV